MRISDWSSDVCSSDLHAGVAGDRKRVRIFPYAQKAAEAEKCERKDIATREYELLREVRHDHILSPGQLTESDSKEESRGGKKGGSKLRSRGSTYHSKKTTKKKKKTIKNNI